MSYNLTIGSILYIQAGAPQTCSAPPPGTTLNKHVGCFNHRVVTKVADKLRDSGYERFAIETNCIRQPNRQLPSSSYNHNTLTTLRTSMKESLQMHFKFAVRKL